MDDTLVEALSAADTETPMLAASALLQAMAPLAQDPSKTKFTKRLAPRLLSALQYLLESRRTDDATRVLHMLTQAAKRPAQRFSVATVAPAILSSDVLAHLLSLAYAQEPAMQEAAIVLVAALLSHHPSLVSAAADVVGPLLRLVLDFGRAAAVSHIAAASGAGISASPALMSTVTFDVALKGIVCANQIVEALTPLQRSKLVANGNTANMEALSLLLRLVPWLGDYEMQIETLQLLLSLSENRMDALARAATSVNPTADSGYPPPLPLSAASSIAAFKAEDFERSATALLRTLNLDCKTVISKELEAFSVNGTPLPKAAVEAIAVVHFNRGSGSISFTAGVEALTAYEHLLGPLPVSVFRAQVAQFMVNDAQLVLELAQTDAKTIAPSSNVPSTTRSFTMDFANSLFLQRMAEDIFGAHKQANKSLPRASMTAPLLIIQPGAQVPEAVRQQFQQRLEHGPQEEGGHHAEASQEVASQPLLGPAAQEKLSSSKRLQRSEAALHTSTDAPSAAAATAAASAGNADLTVGRPLNPGSKATKSRATTVKRQPPSPDNSDDDFEDTGSHRNRQAATTKNGVPPSQQPLSQVQPAPASAPEVHAPGKQVSSRKATTSAAVIPVPEEEQENQEKDRPAEPTKSKKSLPAALAKGREDPVRPARTSLPAAGKQTKKALAATHAAPEEDRQEAEFEAELQELVAKLKAAASTKNQRNTVPLSDHFQAATPRSRPLVKEATPRYTPLTMKEDKQVKALPSEPAGVPTIHNPSKVELTRQAKAEYWKALQRQGLNLGNDDLDSDEASQEQEDIMSRDRKSTARQDQQDSVVKPATKLHQETASSKGKGKRQTTNERAADEETPGFSLANRAAKRSKRTNAEGNSTEPQRAITFSLDASLNGRASAEHAVEEVSQCKQAMLDATQEMEADFSALMQALAMDDVQQTLDRQRQQLSKQSVAARRELKRLATAGGDLVASASLLSAQRQSAMISVLETFKAQTRGVRQLQESSKQQQQHLTRLLADSDARGQDAVRELRQALNAELDDMSRSQAKRQQQLVQLLTVLSNEV